ncbi:MAG: hypothetical protein O2797_08995 [Bacteroidetes bacterium]|nr:hypothetical protein [Bacteroidota bacterium]
MSDDKKTIGVTRENQAALSELVDDGYFASEIDAAKFAMAHAIKNDLQSRRTPGADTKWNVGSVDPDGTLAALLRTLYPETCEPYRLLEDLINVGLAELTAGDRSPDVYNSMFG